MPTTLRLNRITIIGSTFDDRGDLLRRSRERDGSWSDGDVEVIAIHIYGLIEEIAGESDTANICQGILKTGLQIITATGNGN
jgi:hypothetical protein